MGAQRRSSQKQQQQPPDEWRTDALLDPLSGLLPPFRVLRGAKQGRSRERAVSSFPSLPDASFLL